MEWYQITSRCSQNSNYCKYWIMRMTRLYTNVLVISFFLGNSRLVYMPNIFHSKKHALWIYDQWTVGKSIKVHNTFLLYIYSTIRSIEFPFHMDGKPLLPVVMSEEHQHDPLERTFIWIGLNYMWLSIGICLATAWMAQFRTPCVKGLQDRSFSGFGHFLLEVSLYVNMHSKCT